MITYKLTAPGTRNDPIFAFQWQGDFEALGEWMDEAGHCYVFPEGKENIYTLDAELNFKQVAKPGDWLVKTGSRYSVFTNDIFLKILEPVSKHKNTTDDHKR